MRKFKTSLLAALFIVLGTSAFAADATVTFVSGKVEVQRDGKWIALQKGDTVLQSETISTGFQSEAKIKVLESVMYLGPVTRITLEELSSTEQNDNVNVYLKTGTARSQVRHIDNKRVNYQVHTAVAVASCRGTGWIMDDSNTVEVTENTVEVGLFTQPAGVLVQENQTVTVSETNSVSQPVSTVEKSATEVINTVASTSAKESEGGAGLGGGIVSGRSGGNVAAGNSADAGDTIASVVVLIEIPEE